MEDERAGQFTKDIKILARPQDIRQRRLIEMQAAIDKAQAGCDTFISDIQSAIINRVNRSDGKSAIYINGIYDSHLTTLPYAVQNWTKKIIKRWVRMYGYIVFRDRMIPIGKGLRGKVGTAARCWYIGMEEPWPGMLILLTTGVVISAIIVGIVRLASLLF